MKKRLVIGSSGASGMPVLAECLKMIKEDPDFESHLVLSESAKVTIAQESEQSVSDICRMADQVYEQSDIGAGPASGTFETEGMLIVPCSMKTLAGIHSGYAENLLLRSADVCIKEKRPLVLAVRETPLSPIHLRNMQELSMLPEVYVMPLVMSFYMKPETIGDMIHHMACKLLQPFGVKTTGYQRWDGL